MMTKYKELAEKIGALVDEKNKAYGNSFDQAGEFLRLLYPNGIPPEKYTDMLCIIRIFDKLKRIATKKDAFGESPYQDIVGYGLLGLDKDNRARTKAEVLSKITEQVEKEEEDEEYAVLSEEELSATGGEESKEDGSGDEPTFLKPEPNQPALLQDSLAEKTAEVSAGGNVDVNCVICKEFVANVPVEFAETQKLFAHEKCYNNARKI